MAKKAVVKKVVKKPETLFNPATIEQGKVTRTDIYREVLTENPGATWGAVKDKVAAKFAMIGFDFDEKKTGGAFNVFKGGNKNKDGVGAIGGKTTGVTLKQFAALTADLDPSVLDNAIKVIGQVGGIDNARALSKKWKELTEAIGEEAAKKAIEIL